MENDDLYLKQCGLKEKFTIDEGINKLFWGTYSLPPKRPVRWIRLVDCSTNHLKNILQTQWHIHNSVRVIIQEILIRRKQLRFDTSKRISGLTGG